MNESQDRPALYSVSYSGRVIAELKILGSLANERGMGSQFSAALREIDRRLRIYPQFGQPLMDLNRKPLQIWIGVVPPLVVQYILDEEKRQVLIGRPPTLLSNSGF